jgi:hypothetical protein
MHVDVFRRAGDGGAGAEHPSASQFAVIVLPL